MQNFANANVFVAGGTSGLNLGIAEAFSRVGARVAVLSRTADKVHSAVQKLRGAGAVDAMGFAVDVRDAGAVEAAIQGAASAWGPIDVLVSGAAGNFLAAGADLSPNGFKSVVDIDLLGTFNVLNRAWPHLRKPGASVINITAAQSWLPTPMQVHVCAAKAGIDQITRTLAIEWGPSGVRVNAVAPGPIEGTEGMQRLAPTPAAHQAWTEAVPLRRFGSAQDIAKAVMWLSSPDAAYLTGVVLPVDGGVQLSGSGVLTRAIGA